MYNKIIPIMKNHKSNLLESCLFFTANSLARVITKMGEEEFAGVGMTPSYAFLLTLVIDNPGISQKELASQLHIAPSTVSRFVDTLVIRGFITKKSEGRNTFIYPTKTGKSLKPGIEKVWHGLYERYSKILGKEHGEMLTELTANASKKLYRE
jgi:MarR family transcriptional regulator, organic hydroperoxide resistance regulator